MAPITDDERNQVSALHAEGLGRNEISRRTGIHTRRVSAIAAELGVTFVRGAAVQVATEARKIDARARRTALALALLDDAERLRGQLFAACTVYAFGGKDNTFEQATIDQPSFRDKRDLMHAIGIAVDRAVRLDEYDRDQDGGEAKSVIGDLMKGLKQAWQDAATS